MRPQYRIAVQRGSNLTVSPVHLDSLQEVVALMGADTYPLFIKLFASQELRLQPVTARALLSEIEGFTAKLQTWIIPGIAFYDSTGETLGRMYARGTGKLLVRTDKLSLTPTYEGIHVTLKQFPPPVGFRSRPDLPAGHYECFFVRLVASPEGMMGERTEEMGGSGALVPLPPIKFPPVTQWDYARVSGKPQIGEVRFSETPAPSVYHDVIHTVSTACLESIRLMTPVTFIKD